MAEKHEIPPEICPICYRSKTDHAPDCDYEQKIEQYKKSEGITPEFEAKVKSGEITFDKQMEEVNEVWKELSKPLVLTQIEIIVAQDKFISSFDKFKKSRETLFSHDPKEVARAASLINGLHEILLEIKKLDGDILDKVEEIKNLSESPDAVTPEIADLIDEVESSVSMFAHLVSDFEDKFSSFTG